MVMSTHSPLARRRILVVGNYAGDAQYSMQLFGRTLVDHLRQMGEAVDFVQPPMTVARLVSRIPRLTKLAGYIDKYLIFPFVLRCTAGRYDCVHIIDHSNAPYRAFTGRTPVLITCHDLFAVQIMLGEIEGQSFGRSGRLLQKWVLGSLKKQRHFSCVTDQSAEELKRLASPPLEPTVIPNALSPAFSPMADSDATALTSALGIRAERPFFLHVGGNNFYKNRPGVVHLFKLLSTQPGFEDHRLVLAGKLPDKSLNEAIADSGLGDRIDIIVGASDDDIRALYTKARALLFISLAEGFGWPIVEAQACGCVVVTSAREPMRTVAGGAAIMVDPENLAEAATKIAEALSSAGDLIEDGFGNAAAYAPDQVFPRYLASYDACIDDNRKVGALRPSGDPAVNLHPDASI